MRYGDDVDQPITPANAETSMTNRPTTAGTLRTAQLQQSYFSSQQAQSPEPTGQTGQVPPLQVVAGDISQLSRNDPLHNSDIQRVYASMLTSIFRSNDSRLSQNLIDELLDRTVNQQNKLTIRQLWEQDCVLANNRGIVDTLIQDHSHHGYGADRTSHPHQPVPQGTSGGTTTNHT